MNLFESRRILGLFITIGEFVSLSGQQWMGQRRLPGTAPFSSSHLVIGGPTNSTTQTYILYKFILTYSIQLHSVSDSSLQLYQCLPRMSLVTRGNSNAL